MRSVPDNKTTRAIPIGARIGVLVVLSLLGCRSLFDEQPTTPSSILKAVHDAGDGVRYEVYWANLPPGIEEESLEQGGENLWSYVQEERLDEQTRLRLRRNGLRAGIVGGAPPKQIVRLLDPLDKRSEPTDPSAGVDEPETLSPPTGVKRQVTTIRPERPAEINASPIIASTMLLLSDENGPEGVPFERVQAVYRLGVEPTPGGGFVTLLTPELHYGDPKNRWTADDSGLIHRPQLTRERRVFDKLRIEAPLVVGEMLLVTGLPGRESQLGGVFHRAEGGAQGQRKAIVVRMVQAPPSPDFAANRGADTRPLF